MKKTAFKKHPLPSGKKQFLISKAALGLLLAVLLLVILLVCSTLDNIQRAQLMMEKLLVQKGELTIRSIEAGTRTFVHHRGEGEPLQTLLIENSRLKDILFIRIYNKEGALVAQTGAKEPFPLSSGQVQMLSEGRRMLIDQNKELGQFYVTRRFHLNIPRGRGPGMRKGPFLGRMSKKPPWLKDIKALGELVISVGLLTDEFDIARRQTVTNSILMGAVLFLVGSAGFYFLYLYQGMRVTKATLANMRLYTDNVIESMPAGLLTIDSNDRIVSCNRRAEEIFGKGAPEIEGKLLLEMLPGLLGAGGDELADLSMELVRDDGTIPVKISSSRLLDHDGIGIGSVMIIRDISQLMAMELQLERSRRMAALGKMAAGIAHEIRNPLGTLRGFAHFFRDRAGNDAKSRSYGDLMISEVDRLNQNISGLLQFARPREPQKQKLVLSDLLDKTRALMEPDCQAKSIELSSRCESDLTVKADPDLLLQVLLNLVKNSINSCGVGESITLLAKRVKGEIVISVSDTGVGMSKKVRQRMFDPFFTTKKEGTGLGLAVSHQIVEQHDGRFEVSTREGNGTEIRMILPRE